MTVVTNESLTKTEELRRALKVEPPGRTKWLNQLIYADPGTGKTFYIGTAEDHEETSPVLVFDVEGGLMTIEDRPMVDTIKVRSRKDLVDAYNKLYHSIEYDELGIPHIYYKTLGIDSLPELAALDMRDIMKAAYNANPDKVTLEVPSPREWGICREHVREIVRAFRDLPCNVIYTAHVDKEIEEGRPTKFYPGFAGKLRNDVPGFMDIVAYYYVDMTTGTPVRKMQTQGTNRIVAKDRTKCLDPVEINPTVPSLWAKIQSPKNQIETTEVIAEDDRPTESE